MYFPSWEKIASLKHYTRSGLVVSTVSVGLIILFLCVGFPPELVFNEVALTIFSTAAVVSHLFSNGTYIAGTIDQFEESDPKTKKERWMTLAGIIIGFVCGIALSLTLPSITFFTLLSTTTVTTGAIAGLCNRFGGIERRPPFERFCLIASALLGASMGCALLYFGIPIMHITGVISFITAGPPLIASAIFLSLATSLFMSGGDYFSKSIMYLRGRFKNDRHHEYEGSFFGSLFSIVAIIFFVTHLHLLVGVKLTLTGLNIAATTITLFAKCFGIDGICSRIGRTLDKLFDEEDTIYEKTVKVVLVITGIEVFMVIADMCVKLKNYLSYIQVTDALAEMPAVLLSNPTSLILHKTLTYNHHVPIPRSIYATSEEETKTSTTLVKHGSNKRTRIDFPLLIATPLSGYWCYLLANLPGRNHSTQNQNSATVHSTPVIAVTAS